MDAGQIWVLVLQKNHLDGHRIFRESVCVVCVLGS